MPSEAATVDHFNEADVDSVEEAIGATEERIASVSTVTRVILLRNILQNVQREMLRATIAGKPGIMSARART